MRRSSGAFIALTCAVVVSSPGMAFGESSDGHFQFLHVTPTEVEPGYDPEGPLVVAVAVGKPSVLEQVLDPKAVLQRSEDELTVRLLPYPSAPPEDPERHLRSTFLLDFETDAVRGLISSRPDEARPTPADLIAWTRDVIEPAMDRNADSASVIAENGRGDCTEFAVLLGALARSFDYPARIIVGLVVLEEQGKLQAFGHAWTEVFSGGAWQLVDATPFGGASARGYLPAGTLRDEGPGYSLELMRIHGAEIRSVRVLARESSRTP